MKKIRNVLKTTLPAYSNFQRGLLKQFETPKLQYKREFLNKIMCHWHMTWEKLSRMYKGTAKGHFIMPGGMFPEEKEKK